jgi:hypothetical protein
LRSERSIRNGKIDLGSSFVTPHEFEFRAEQVVCEERYRERN